jgi:hypothetical protein
VHDGSEYVATVGEAMRKRSYSRNRREARMGMMGPESITRERVLEIKPPETAIAAWLVFLDPQRSSGRWANPFMVGPEDLRDASYFSDEP